MDIPLPDYSENDVFAMDEDDIDVVTIDVDTSLQNDAASGANGTTRSTSEENGLTCPVKTEEMKFLEYCHICACNKARHRCYESFHGHPSVVCVECVWRLVSF
jgi:hypothetical protein